MNDLFPAIETVLPHVGPAVLLSRVIAHEGDRTVCIAAPERARLYRGDDGEIPSWVGIEIMAQCVAARGGLKSLANGEPPRLGFLLGSRRLELPAATLPCDRELEVHAEHLWGDQRMVAFSCSIRDARDGDVLVAAKINAYVPDDEELAQLGLESSRLGLES
jgi:predicted hotdog family 3-hydroxylacyl-ACP dehydratase